MYHRGEGHWHVNIWIYFRRKFRSASHIASSKKAFVKLLKMYQEVILKSIWVSSRNWITYIHLRFFSRSSRSPWERFSLGRDRLHLLFFNVAAALADSDVPQRCVEMTQHFKADTGEMKVLKLVPSADGRLNCAYQSIDQDWQ